MIYNPEMEGKTPDEHTLEDQITDHFSEWYSFISYKWYCLFNFKFHFFIAGTQECN